MKNKNHFCGTTSHVPVILECLHDRRADVDVVQVDVTVGCDVRLRERGLSIPQVAVSESSLQTQGMIMLRCEIQVNSYSC